MNCCRPQNYNDLFDKKTARRELRKYRRRGPSRTTRALIDALEKQGVKGATLLDIGGGVGAIQHALLADGVTKALHVDASAAYIEASREEARRRGHEDRVDYRYGDFVALAPEIDAVDVVTLDRVICCYEDMRSLVTTSAQRAKRLYGVVYPRSTSFVRFLVVLFNLFLRITRKTFRVYVHPTDDVEAEITRDGLRRSFHREFLFWQVAVFARNASGD